MEVRKKGRKKEKISTFTHKPAIRLRRWKSQPIRARLTHILQAVDLTMTHGG